VRKGRLVRDLEDFNFFDLEILRLRVVKLADVEGVGNGNVAVGV
jgi:hypothetical protein